MQLGSLVCDMIARIKNGSMAKKLSVEVVKSTFVLNILNVLKEEGYISNFFATDKLVTVYLKYDENKKAILRNICSISKPGLRKYIDKRGALSRELFGIHILSTSKGVMSGVKAHSLGIGGELLMEVY